jgi:hypothetical protein
VGYVSKVSLWPDVLRVLGCYAACGGFIPTFQDYLSVPFSRIKLRLIDSLEISVSEQLTPRNNPEDGRIHFDHRGSVSERTVCDCSLYYESVCLTIDIARRLKSSWNTNRILLRFVGHEEDCDLLLTRLCYGAVQWNLFEIVPGRNVNLSLAEKFYNPKDSEF